MVNVPLEKKEGETFIAVYSVSNVEKRITVKVPPGDPKQVIVNVKI